MQQKFKKKLSTTLMFCDSHIYVYNLHRLIINNDNNNNGFV